VLDQIEGADGLLIGTGTYWGQSSSTLQRFWEDATPSEGSRAWLGLPTAVVVSEHSTGGQSVAQALAATVAAFGGFVVPQGWLVFSRAGQEAKRNGAAWSEDVWGPDDVRCLCRSLATYASLPRAPALASWPVDGDAESFHGLWAAPRPRPRRAGQRGRREP
jgi:multimeric flavodoxin WrbA